MSLDDCGSAVVLIYGDGLLLHVLVHPRDGGEAYMGPLLRKAVQYAKTHYDSGNILDVLMSEGEMTEIAKETVAHECEARKVRHAYYVSYRWDADNDRKSYRVYSLHVKRGHIGEQKLPDRVDATGAVPGASALM